MKSLSAAKTLQKGSRKHWKRKLSTFLQVLDSIFKYYVFYITIWKQFHTLCNVFSKYKYVGCASGNDLADCECSLTAEFHADNYVDPLTVVDIVNPTAYLKVINNGTEPAYDARLVIDSDVLLEHDDVTGCKSLSIEVKILYLCHCIKYRNAIKLYIIISQPFCVE